MLFPLATSRLRVSFLKTTSHHASIFKKFGARHYNNRSHHTDHCPHQKTDLDTAVQNIIDHPEIGEAKVGDLAGISVYKFSMVKQQTLLAYQYEDQTITLTLLTLGTHVYFYRDLKKA
jgi:hypothetical protein